MTHCPITLHFRFSVSNDLKYDAERDLRDIGAKNIQVHSLNKVSTAVHTPLTSLFISLLTSGQASSEQRIGILQLYLFM